MENHKIYLLYCPIFKNELHAVLGKTSNLTLYELGYDVHNHPARLLKQLKEGIRESREQGGTFNILVGSDCECTVPIRELTQEKNNGSCPDQANCFEIFLGREKTLQLQKNRTVLMTPGWIEMIKNVIASDLWTVEDARISLGWYDRILLLDTQVTEISDEEIMDFYDLVQVPIEIMEIELDHFRGVVEKLID